MNNQSPVAFQDLVQKCLSATSVEDIHHICSLACEQFEFDQFLYGSRIPTSFTRPQLIIISGYQQDWWDHYNQQNYIKVDPVLNYCTSHTLPIQWHQLELDPLKDKQAKDLMLETASFGLKSGISLPVHSPKGDFAMLSFASDQDAKQNEDRINQINPQLMMLAYHIHEASMRIFRHDKTDLHDTLTKREKECLLWAAEGKTSDETSMILHISESTVRFHLNNAAKKLNVHSRRHAIARAICLGVITPVI